MSSIIVQKNTFGTKFTSAISPTKFSLFLPFRDYHCLIYIWQHFVWSKWVEWKTHYNSFRKEILEPRLWSFIILNLFHQTSKCLLKNFPIPVSRSHFKWRDEAMVSAELWHIFHAFKRLSFSHPFQIGGIESHQNARDLWICKLGYCFPPFRCFS